MTNTTVILSIVIVALVFYIHYQRRLYLEKLQERFVCHYCGHSFGVDQLDKSGKYDYCKQHGLKRQKELNV